MNGEGYLRKQRVNPAGRMMLVGQQAGEATAPTSPLHEAFGSGGYGDPPRARKEEDRIGRMNRIFETRKTRWTRIRP
jgi:hypothetical protein